MKTFLFFCFSLFLLFSNKVNGQSLTEIAEKFSPYYISTTAKLNTTRMQQCDPDSIIFYGFISPEDSVVSLRRIFRRYGEVSRAIYEYEFVDDTEVLKLGSIDSTLYDNAGRPILNEIREFDFDSSALLLEERTIYFPHEGSVIKDYSFLEHMVNELNFVEGDFVDFDSAIVYRRDFFTGNLLPYQKFIHTFSGEGRLEEMYHFNYSEFDMSWFPVSKSEVLYTPSGRIAEIVESTWDGINDYNVSSTSAYTYDSNDSLLTVILKNNITGSFREKLEMSYDNTQNASTALVFTWDENLGDWFLALRLYGVFDDQSRLEKYELDINFFGSAESSRNEYKYIGNSSCPHYIDAFYFEDGEWVFTARIYFYPSMMTSVYEAAIPQWNAYPNPANEGIWIEAPIGSQVQVSTIQGFTIYNGIIKSEKEYLRLHQTSTQMIITIINNSFISSRLITVCK